MPIHIRHEVSNVVLSGTDTLPFQVHDSAVSVTVKPNSSTVGMSVRPGSRGDFAAILPGESLTFELNGFDIAPDTWQVTATAAVTAIVIIAYRV